MSILSLLFSDHTLIHSSIETKFILFLQIINVKN
jgi:hypothetical protein